MIKKNRKWVSILITLTFLATMLLPMATPALAKGTVDPLNAGTETSPSISNLATLSFTVPAGQVTDATLYIKLDSDYAFTDGTKALDPGLDLKAMGQVVANSVVNDAYPSIVYPKTANTDYVDVSAAVSDFRVYPDSHTLRIIFNNTDTTNDLKFQVTLPHVMIPSGITGDIEANITSNDSDLNLGRVVVGTCGTGKVGVQMDDVKSFTDSVDLTFYVAELSANSMESDSQSVKIKLPNGFEWVSAYYTGVMWGQGDYRVWGAVPSPTGANKAPASAYSSDGRTLYIDTSVNKSVYSKDYPTSKTAIRIDAKIQVSDPTVAKYGDVVATISGKSDIATGTVVMAKYGDYGVTISADAPDVLAGKVGQQIGDITIEESSAGSLIGSNRSIILTLPANAKWVKVPEVDDYKVSVDEPPTFVGTDGRSIKYLVTGESLNDAGKIILKKGKVALAPDVTGDLKIEVSGTSGAKGEVIAAKVLAPVTVEGNKPQVIIGEQAQAAGDITVTEAKPEVVKGGSDRNIVLETPAGVRFAETPTVEVLEGDLVLDTNNMRLTSDDHDVIIPVKSDSANMSKFKVSNIKYTVDRTYPVGDIKLKVGGNALVEINDYNAINEEGTAVASSDFKIAAEGTNATLKTDGTGTYDYDANNSGLFPGADWVAQYANATCMTPSPKDSANKVEFKIGGTNYTMNGNAVTMDVAPYVKDGRTFLPVRYVANALGVTDDNILWDEASQKVTLLKNGIVVQMTIGSPVLLVNGAAITMDVAPEITSGRTMLPVRFVAQALGATVGWDETTQTVTLTL